MRRRITVACLMAVLFAGVCVLENGAVRARPVKPADQGSASVYMLAGEFRAVFANLLWVKAEQYHHEFIEHNPHWTQNKELLGLLELIVTIDPTFVEAYADAAYIQADGCKDTQKAIATLRRGIAGNPQAWELYSVTAIMYAGRLHDPKAALLYAVRAAQYARDDFDRRRTLMLLATVRKMVAEQERATADGGQHAQIHG